MKLLIRYDVEGGGEKVTGFLEKAVKVHRKDAIPAGFFCVASEIESRPEEFKDFYSEVKSDALFDVQDHSYSRVPLCYEDGPSLEAIEEDYRKSLDVFERVLGFKPLGTSLCASADCGKGLPGFDASSKARKELDILAKLGFKMTTTALSGHVRMHEFVSYGELEHPDMMGFPSGNGDKNWLMKPTTENPLDALFEVMRRSADEGRHLGIVLHDWVTFNHAPDRHFSHVRRIADMGRMLGFELAHHSSCYKDSSLWS
jgi:peptidoglycan/xylan/chitin deacetylase (PgdA/CDA1 family)